MRIAKIVNIKTQIQHDYCMRGYKIMYKKYLLQDATWFHMILIFFTKEILIFEQMSEKS